MVFGFLVPRKLLVMLKKYFLIVLLGFITSTACTARLLAEDATQIVLVKNNLATSQIVISKNASSQIKTAAATLQDYIKRSTSATIPIVTQPKRDVNSLYVGLSPFVNVQTLPMNRFSNDGYVLKQIDDRNFIIAGNTDFGTEFGVYDFLERFVGISWLMPTDLGTDIPISSDLIIPPLQIIESPVFLSRQLSPININEASDLGKWGRMNRLRGTISFHHNMKKLFDPKDYGRSNPDFYSSFSSQNSAPAADVSGKTWQPNFSAPGIADTAAMKIIRFFKQNPQELSYSLGVNDGTKFDESAASRRRRSGKMNYLGLEDVSDDYFQWANSVVKKVNSVYPGKLFGLLAYNNVAEPPSKAIGIDSGIIPFLTYERLKWIDENLRNEGHQLTESWGSQAQQLGFYDYAYGLNYLLPRVWFHEMQQYLIWGANHKVKYYYAELYPNWGEGPKAWVQAKLLWNPYYNVDSLLNVWYIKTAGEKAAPKLKAFYSIWEDFWTKDILNTNWFTQQGQYLPYRDLSYLDAVTKKSMVAADALMEDAIQLAGTPEEKQRVLELSKMWQLYKTAIVIYQRSGFTNKAKTNQLKTSSDFLSVLNNLQNDPLYNQTFDNMRKQLKISDSLQ